MFLSGDQRKPSGAQLGCAVQFFPTLPIFCRVMAKVVREGPSNVLAANSAAECLHKTIVAFPKIGCFLGVPIRNIMI